MVEKIQHLFPLMLQLVFVMTADAVRAAGGGSIDKGADKMYNLMKDLEAKV